MREGQTKPERFEITQPSVDAPAATLGETTAILHPTLKELNQPMPGRQPNPSIRNFGRPCGTRSRFGPDPAMNRRAILRCSCGTILLPARSRQLPPGVSCLRWYEPSGIPVKFVSIREISVKAFFYPCPSVKFVSAFRLPNFRFCFSSAVSVV